MEKEKYLNDPWLVAAWPGMGAVAINADYYLMAKLGMHLLAEYPAREFFETRRLPRSRLFMWQDPQQRHDLIVFIGEAQPPSKGAEFCAQLIDHASRLGVSRVFTFAAMATQMRPEHDCQVFGAAIDRESLADFKRLNLEILKEGHISGLNGVLLAVAAERGLSGGCLLGGMPHVFSQFPFPKASLAVLEAFSKLAGLSIDLAELREQAELVEKELGSVLHRLEGSPDSNAAARAVETIAKPVKPKKEVGRDQKRIDDLFASARRDRSRAYELKRELDRQQIFSEYEDRFLDLFKEPD